MNAVIIKTSLVLYVLLAGISIFILWKNADAPDGLKNVGAILGSILPIAIFGFSYLAPDKEEKKYHLMVLFDSKTKIIVYGSKPNDYTNRLQIATADLTPIGPIQFENESELMQKKGLDFIERLIITQITMRFQQNWDYIFNKMEGPGFSQTAFTPGGNPGKKIIDQNMLKQAFADNWFYGDAGAPVLWPLCIPSDAELNRRVGDHFRVVAIQSERFDVAIRISFQSNMVLQNGIPGVLEKDPSDVNRYYAAFYEISVFGMPPIFGKYSTGTKTYQRWFENISDVVSDLDWEKLNRKIKDTMLAEASHKILN